MLSLSCPFMEAWRSYDTIADVYDRLVVPHTVKLLVSDFLAVRDIGIQARFAA
jgi:hypothetical protein